MNRKHAARHMSALTWNTPREQDLEEVARAAAESAVRAVHPGQTDTPAPYTLAARGRHAGYDRFFPSLAIAPAAPARRSLWARIREAVVSTTHTEPDAWDMLAGSPLTR